MNDSQRMERLNELNQDVYQVQEHLKRIKKYKEEKNKGMNISTFLCCLLLIVAATVAANQAFAKPLGGWDTFPGPVSEPTDCKPTRKTRCA